MSTCSVIHVLCPFCASEDTKVTNSRVNGYERTRKRVCAACSRTFSTAERLVSDHLLVRKRDGSTEPFDRTKLAKGIDKAASVYGLSPADVNAFVDRVIRGLQTPVPGVPIRSEDIGHQVLQQLHDSTRNTDVARIRYAIVFLGRTTRPDGFRGLRDFLGWLREAYGKPRVTRPTGTPWVVRKRNGRLEPFQNSKLARSIGISAKGRGSDEDVRRLAQFTADATEKALKGQTLVTSQQVAAEVLKILREKDPLAYLRYGSAAKRYETVDEFWLDAYGLEEG